MDNSLLDNIRYISVDWDIVTSVVRLFSRCVNAAAMTVLITVISTLLAQHTPTTTFSWHWLQQKDNLESVYWVALLGLYFELPWKR